MSVIAATTAAAEEGFSYPGVADFWQPLFGTDGAFAVTRSSVVFALSVVLISVVMLRATRRMTLVPSKGQMLIEGAYGFVRNSIARDLIGSKEFLKFVPLLFSMFVVILVNNLFGIVPLIQFPTMSRVAFPVAITVVIFVLYHALGVRHHGFFGWFKRMGVPPGVPIFLLPIIFLLEMINYFFTRPVSLSLRLFGNMFAGHLLLLLFILGGEHLLLHGGSPVMAISGVFTIFMAFLMTLFELLVEVLQAYIFTLLAALYIADAVSEEH